MKLISRGCLFSLLLILFLLGNSIVFAEDVVIVPLKPDSIHVTHDGENVRIRWYPPPYSETSAIGTEFYENWYYGHDETDRVEVEFIGEYNGLVDRQLLFSLEKNDIYHVASSANGGSPSIKILIECTDKFWEYNTVMRKYRVIYETYKGRIDIGTEFSYGDTIPIVLRGGDPFRELNLGLSVYFHDGYVDTSVIGSSASFNVDMQTFEGFHVWRKEVQNNDPGKYPRQDEMTAIAEISKEEYYLYSKITRPDQIPPKRIKNWEYFNDYGIEKAYPRVDSLSGNNSIYYEWVDKNAFPGFKYYYSVTSYDRGYYLGASTGLVKESYICDNDSIQCSEVMGTIWVDSPYKGEMKGIYAVPNPFRTGTSAQTTPHYHNYDDGNYVKFHNVPPNAKLRIFTVAGDLVWKIVHDNFDGGEGIIKWDGSNMEGRQVGSGVYIYRCEDSNGSDTYGKVVVIR